ncbi:hypothetical protein [Nocardia huaxiensis]|uniref:hypothetical protein n=1 Tax=Nocardia huaxiensis TaxID=2755382 RepID=UPI001E5E6F3F|nr:hypothetical protein [Nocardia huaxiensis]UFS97892.1 hypothetical protein LPY97_08325 [Nocardia huaxiensis]
MALPHARTRLDWSDLSALVVRYRDPGIELPVGVCGRVHLEDRRTAGRVERRKYLAHRVCRQHGCATRGTDLFRKNRGFTVMLPGELPRATREILRASARLSRFATTLGSLIEDSARYVPMTAKPVPVQHHRTGYHAECRCLEVVTLMEVGDAQTLLSLGDREIRAVLEHRHGGQAVGNNLRFLLYHVLHVYLRTNLIAEFGLEDRPEEWGSLRPGTVFRQQLMSDCDGLTFLPSARRHLTDGVFMVDAHATDQLVTACFRFLAHYQLLCDAVDYELDWNALIRPELGLA